MKLTVVLPFFNNEKTIADQLDALVEQQWDEPWEIIAVDNGSTDRSREIALETVFQTTSRFDITI